MIESIKIGDLVMLVGGHQCVLERISGVVFHVTELHSYDIDELICGHCGDSVAFSGEKTVVCWRPGKGVPVSWVKKLLPPSDELKREVIEELFS